MTSKAKTMLILSCIFVTICALLLAYDAYLSISAYVLLFNKDAANFGEALGQALGGVLLYALTIIFGIFVVASAAVSLPFSITLLKINGKKWYSITLLAFAVFAILAAITFVALLPVISQAEEAAKAASSSSSAIESAEALLLL